MCCDVLESSELSLYGFGDDIIDGVVKVFCEQYVGCVERSGAAACERSSAALDPV